MPPTDDNSHDQQHVFFKSADGHVQHVFWDQLAQRFHADVWTRRTAAPLAVGDVASLITDCRQHVFYRDAHGHINYIFWDVPSATLHHAVLPPVAPAPLAAGNPVPLETPGQLHVFYRGVDGALEHIVWNAASDGIVFSDNWTTKANAPPMVGDPAVLSTPGQQHAFYRGGDGHIHHIVWNGGTPPFGVDDWTARAGAGTPLAAADPVAMLVGDQQHVFYRGANGHINHIFWAPSSAGPRFDDWTASAQAPLAAGDHAAPMLTPGQQHVFYRGLGGEIIHILWNSGSAAFGWDDWTSRSGAPAAAGDPTTLTTGGQQHIFHAGANGGIIHILWQAGLAQPRWDDWTLRSGTAAAIAGRITAFRSSEGPDPSALRILALGDSMTEGYNVQGTGGYRAPLFHKAHSAGKHIVFVGSRFDGPARVDGVCFPRAHEGHSGKNIDFIASLLPGVLMSKPKIVLLMIGANDVLTMQCNPFNPQLLDEAPKRLGKLLDALLDADPGMLVVVAQIPPMIPLFPPDPNVCAYRAVSEKEWKNAIAQYNAGVRSVVSAQMALGRRLILVDMHAGFKDAMWGIDQIHPNEDGYKHMAAIWYQAIGSYLT